MTDNPFTADIFPDGLPASGGTEALHGGALHELHRMVERAARARQTGAPQEGGGSVVLLRAPRAGFGKSRLLARLAGELEGRAFVIALPFDRERPVSWSTLLWQVLGAFHGEKTGGLTRLDRLARRLFAAVNRQMILAGQIPCHHPAEAMAALEERSAELFDFTSPAQPVARWFSDHFERLLPFAAAAAGQTAGLAVEAAAHWLRVLCAYAQGQPEREPVRWESLRWSAMEPSSPALPRGGMQMVSAPLSGEAAAREKAVEFCRLAASVQPLVLVFDDLDLFHRQTEPAQRLAGFITELRRLLVRSVSVLSVNDDLWNGTFLQSLPSALEDRLTGHEVALGPLHPAEAAPFIRHRMAQAGLDAAAAETFLRRLDLPAWFSREPGRAVSPRVLLRYAAHVWETPQDQFANPAPLPAASVLLPGIPAAPLPFLTIPGPPAAASAPAGDLTLRLEQLRAHFLAAPGLSVDQDRLFHLLKIAGSRLAVVTWSGHPLPGSPGQSAGAWTSPDGEILFGSEPYTDHDYWSALVQFAGERSRSRPPGACRLVVFSTREDPVPLASWMSQDEITGARTRFLEVQPVEASMLATLYAADELLREAARNASGPTPAETFARLVPHLECLWKQVTRRPAAG